MGADPWCLCLTSARPKPAQTETQEPPLRSDVVMFLDVKHKRAQFIASADPADTSDEIKLVVIPSRV